MAFKSIKKIPKIIQTKIPPNSDPKLFEEELLKSFEKLQVKKIDLLAIHGINLPEHLHQAVKDGGCIDILKKFQKRKFNWTYRIFYSWRNITYRKSDINKFF